MKTTETSKNVIYRDLCVLDLVVYLGIKVENYSFNTKASKKITKLVNYGWF